MLPSRRRATPLLAVLAALTVPVLTGALTSAAAEGHAGAAAPAPGVSPQAYAGLVRGAPGGPCDGMFEVRVAGAVGCTHGPDPAPPDAADAPTSVGGLRVAASARSAGKDPASLTCFESGASGPRAQAVYAVAADKPDRFAAVAPLIRGYARSLDDAVYDSAKKTGGTRRVRWVTEPSPDGGCRIKVAKLALTAGGDDSFNNTVNEASAAGLTDPLRAYQMWVDADVLCGIAFVYPDDSPGADNLNNRKAEGPSTYARSDTGCWGGFTELHELTHNLGGVQDSAPHSTKFGHCFDEYDVMCYKDDAAAPDMQILCPDTAVAGLLDCNDDDYFHTSPAGGSYLATHWNTARNSVLTEAGLVPDAATITTSDGDPEVDPGDDVSLLARVRNEGTLAIDDLTGTLSSPSPEVRSTGPARAYPNAAPGATSVAAAPFSAHLSANAPCGSTVPATVRFTTSAGVQSVGFSLPRGGDVGSRSTSTNSSAAPIPDGNPNGVTSAISVPPRGLLQDLDVALNIQHPYVEDLRAVLTAPDGTTVSLFSSIGGAGDNFTGTVFDDEAPTAIGAGAAPYTGTFRPASPLSVLDGKPVGGTWKLTIVDRLAPDAGTLTSWSVRPAPTVCPAAPGAGWSAPPAGSARGDFNGDGFGDLAIAVPGEDLGTVADAGVVQVLYGSASGLTATGSQLWSQNSAGVADAAEAKDGFGSVLAVGDVDGDGRSDLLAGTPGEDLGGSAPDAGIVQLLRGSAGGLTATGSQLWSQNTAGVADGSGAGDRFGAAVAAGDVNGDGRADVAIGVPDEDRGSASDAGVVHLLRGASTGLTATSSQLWSQSETGIATLEFGDHFGAALAFGNFGGGPQDDLAVGAPGEAVGTLATAGAVSVIYGGASGLTQSASQLWSQDSAGIADGAGTGDGFGASVAAGDVTGDGRADLVVGAPYENDGARGDAGVVHALPGSASGLTATGSSVWSQDSTGVADAGEAGDEFGAAVAAGDFTGDGKADVAIGAPGETVGTVAAAGLVHVLRGSASGPTATSSQTWTQASSGIADTAEAGDRFGASLTAANHGNGTQSDLTIGAPGDSFGAGAGAGVLHAIYGSAAGLSAAGSQLWSQASTGIADHPGAGDGFGSAGGR